MSLQKWGIVMVFICSMAAVVLSACASIDMIQNGTAIVQITPSEPGKEYLSRVYVHQEVDKWRLADM